MKSVCVFCGSSPGLNPVYRQGAIAMGEAIARRGLTLVYGGGAVGLMGVVADAALKAGGAVHGVIPQALDRREVAHKGLTRLEVVDSMHSRKARMAELSDGFIAMPGGIGTFEEMFEIWTWGQLGIHAKPLGFLDIAGFYHGLATFLDHAVPWLRWTPSRSVCSTGWRDGPRSAMSSGSPRPRAEAAGDANDD
jgi:uncharacterized protein (TIGR00730 family)